MMNYIDTFLNKVTMYRLVVYCLLAYLACAVLLGYFGLLPYSPMALVLSTVFITFVCWITNLIFSKTFQAPTNIESVYITALILVFLITPLRSFADTAFYSLAFWAGAIAMASKYVVAIKRKHIFNPAAVGVVVTALFLGQAASWWIGTAWLLVPVLIGGFLVVKKINRFDLVWAFLIPSLLLTLFPHISSFGDMGNTLKEFFLSSPIIFFATIMLTEPLTTPPTKAPRLGYGAFVGVLMAPMVHFGSVYSTPEISLVLGNIVSYIMSPKQKLLLKLKEVRSIGTDTYDFVFRNDQKFRFSAGQYLELTLPHGGSDNRGNRRYFTIASSPTEVDVHFGIKFYAPPSSFKKALSVLPLGGVLSAGGLAGDFTLPKDKTKKLAFIAGGIGITPFRSMAKYLVDANQPRSVVLFYSNNVLADISYTDVFDEAYDAFGFKTVYTLTDMAKMPETWKGEKGFIDAAMIARHAPDYRERTFYISGPHGMVTRYEQVLSGMGVKKSQIKTDFFPGYA